jgi:YVTN family beta-propeller protein
MKRNFRIRAVLSVLCVVSTVFFASTALWGQASLLILSKQDHTLAIVDPASLKVLGKAPVGNDPHEVIASTDGKTAYVSNYGGGEFHTLAVIDLVTMKARPSIDLGPLRGPHGLDFVGGKTWFTAEAAKAVGRYDPVTGKVDWILGTGQNRTHMIHVSNDERRVITSNISSGTISVIDAVPAKTAPGRPARMDWNQTVIPVGSGSEGFDLSPDKKELWTGNAGEGTISVIDLGTKKVVATIQANVRGANRLKFTPDGKDVLVSSLSGPDLVVLDAATRKVVKRIPIGHGAAGIQIEPNGARAFVACSPDNYVAVIDLHTMAVTGHLQVGPNPDGMAWAVRR